MKSSKRKIAGVLIISFLLYKKVKIRNIMISSAVFYSVALLAQGWHWVVAPLSVHLPALWAVVTFFQKILLTTRNGLFVGFPFLGMGMLFAFYKIEMSMKKAVCGFAVSGFLMFLEAFFRGFHHYARSLK